MGGRGEVGVVVMGSRELEVDDGGLKLTRARDEELAQTPAALALALAP